MEKHAEINWVVGGMFPRSSGAGSVVVYTAHNVIHADHEKVGITVNLSPIFIPKSNDKARATKLYKPVRHRDYHADP